MSTIAGMLLRNIQRAPDQVAIEFEGIETTFRGYGERCFRLANALKKRGVRRLDRVAFLAMNTPETLEVYGACEAAGFITSTLNFRLAAAELLWIINDAAPCVLVFEAQYTATIDSIRPSLPTIAHYLCIGECPLWAEPYEAVLAASTITPPDAIPDAADPCLLMYTSGTTGRPKGVLRSQGGEANLAADMAAVLGTAGDSRLLIMMPMFHAGGRSMQLAVHWRAGTIVLHRRFDPIEVLQTIEQRKVTEMHLAPTLLQVILDTPGQENFDLSSIRTVMYAAAPMPVPLLRRGIERFGRVFMDGYGQTEGNGTALYKHQHYMEGTPEQIGRLGSVGQAALDGEIRIVDDADRDCPTGVPGEILIRNHSIMMGYWNNHPATVETLRGGWLHTGDIGRLDGQGFLFHGRPQERHDH